MACSHCGSPAVDLVDQSGGTRQGSFVEKYRCESCGSTGSIRGEASDPPQAWRRTGLVFDGGGGY